MVRQTCKVLYAKYNSARRPDFRVTTEFCEDANGIFVRKRAAEAAAENHLENIFRNSVSLQDYYRTIKVISPDKVEGELKFPCIKGQTLAERIEAQDFDKARFVARVNEALATVLSIQERYFVSFRMTDEFKALFGEMELGEVPALNPANIDPLLTNFIVNDAGTYCIDCEWVCHFPVPFAYIKYRILLYLYVTQVHEMLKGTTLEEMLSWFGFSERDCALYWKMDDHFQQCVHGEDRKYIYTSRYLKRGLSISYMEQQIQDRDQTIASQTAIIQSRDNQIVCLQREVSDREATILNQEETIRSRDETIQNQESAIRSREETIQSQNVQIGELTNSYQIISNSFFWHTTKPARVLTDTMKRLAKRNYYTYIFCRMARDLLRHGPGYVKTNKRLYLSLNRKVRDTNVWLSEEERERQRKTGFSKDITFSILVPLYNTPEKFLREMIQSVQEQTYSKWELCLADGSDDAHAVTGEVCRALARKDSRIRYRKLEKNLGISGNTNACIEMASGNYIALFDHDDILHPSTLYEVMKAICEEDADYIYTDEVTFKSPNRRNLLTVHLKPDFAPDNLLANNYICHFSAFSARLLEAVGGFRPEYDGSQDHDIILRLTNAATKIVHIPKVLYWWRSHPQSVAEDINAKQYAVDAAKRAVHDFLRDYKHVEVQVESTRAFPTIFRIRYPLQSRPKISIVIPNKDHIADLKRCIDAILTKTTYDNYEIVVVENNSQSSEIFDYYSQLRDRGNIRVLRYKGAFNFSKINNWAVSQCDGEYIVLLNNDTEVISPDWLENMLMYAQRNDVGAVGAKLYFPDGRIQHGGIILKLGADRVAGHAHYGADNSNLGYMGRLCYTQDVSAVTAACLMICKDRYDEVGGLNENLAVAFNDVDFCLKLREKGYLNIFTPFAELYHYESISRGMDTGENRERFMAECASFRERWKEVLDKGDPYYNPNFSLDSSMFELL